MSEVFVLKQKKVQEEIWQLVNFLTKIKLKKRWEGLQPCCEGANSTAHIWDSDSNGDLPYICPEQTCRYSHSFFVLFSLKKKDKCNTKRLVEHFTFARLSFNSEWTCSQSHSDLGAFPSPLNCFLVSFSSTVFGSVGKKQQQKCRK